MIYYMLTRGVPYQELGEDYFDAQQRQQVERRFVRRLERLGYAVTLQPPAAAPTLHVLRLAT